MNIYKASDILKNTRIDRQYNLAEVSKKTKIPQKYLEAIESGDCNRYPSEPYCSMFVGKYAKYLGIDEDRITSLFRRDLNQKSRVQNTSRHPFYLTPQFIFSFLVVILILTMFFFLLSRYLSFNKPPSLEVYWPEVTNETQIEIKGMADPNSSVRVNSDLIIIDQDGNFSKLIDISTSQLVEVEVTSPYGKKTTKTHQFTQSTK